MNAPVEVSLKLLEMLHHRWVMLIRGLEPRQWEKSFLHPDSGEVKLATNLGIYAWHGKHHTAHITSLRERMGWS
ncbi:putative metal-dependent hydrolase YfiT [compost metagenome]